MIKALILDYLNHFKDPSFFDVLFSRYSRDQIGQAIIELLREQDQETTGTALFFIRDLCLTPSKDTQHAPYNVIIFGTPIISLIEEHMYSRNYSTRRQAIYTIGKIGSIQSVPKLYQLLEQTKEVDPLLAPRIVTELWWLEPEKNWTATHALITASHYLTRWAALTVLFVYSTGDDLQRVERETLERLRQDTNGRIRDEAEYYWLEYIYRQERAGLTKPERKAQRLHIRSAQPLFLFSDIVTWFENKMDQNQAENYTVDELHDFVEAKAPLLAEERRAYQHVQKKSQ
jgi:hypothetical protein